MFGCKLANFVSMSQVDFCQLEKEHLLIFKQIFFSKLIKSVFKNWFSVEKRAILLYEYEGEKD